MTKPPNKSPTDPGFQFSEDQVEQSWFRRAADAGLRYARTMTERSGMKVLPVLDLESEETKANRRAGVATEPPSEAPSAVPPAPQLKAGARDTLKGRAKEAPKSKPAKASAAPKESDEKPADDAFGPSSVLGHTAINQYLATEEKKRVAPPTKRSVRYPPSTMVSIDDGAETAAKVKRVLALIVAVVIALGVYKVYALRAARAAHAHANDDFSDETGLKATETVLPNKAKKKHKRSTDHDD